MVAVVPEEKNLLVYYINGVATALLKGPSNQWSVVSQELLIHNTYKC